MRRALCVSLLAAGCAGAPSPPAPPPVAVIPVAPPAAAVSRAAVPEPAEPRLVSGLATLGARTIELAGRLRFATDRPDLLPESLPLLDGAAAVLVAYPDVTIEIACHSDAGNAAHALRLSEERAAALRAYLAEHGIPLERLVARGYGPPRPFAGTLGTPKRGCDLVRTDGS